MNKAAAMLVVCCLLWGFSFPAMQLSMQALEKHYRLAPGPADTSDLAANLGLRANFLGWRFCLAASVTVLLFREARRRISRKEIYSGAALGIFFSLGMLCQIAGLRYALPSVSSFLTNLVVIFAPLAQATILRKPVGIRVWMGVALAALGMMFLSLPNTEACAACTVAEKPPIPFLGEILTTLGAIFFTAQMLTLDRVASNCNAVRMTLSMFMTTALISLALGTIICGSKLYSAQTVNSIVTDSTLMLLMLALTLFCSVFAFHLMNHYQPGVSPAAASVIYCMESVFATLFSLLFMTEKLTWPTLAGGALLLTAMAVVSIKNPEENLPALI